MAINSSKVVLLTGAAGFVGFHVANALMAQGHTVVGVDCITDYYQVSLKRDRLALLGANKAFSFHELDIADHAALKAVGEARRPDVVIHLAAQAGVRYSLENPFAYGHSNLMGHLSVMELVRHLPNKLQHVLPQGRAKRGKRLVQQQHRPCP